MCGIAGQIRWDAPTSEARVRRMQRALAHRGPDGEGLAHAGAACLAHTRLALLDLTGGHQPIESPDRRWLLTYNGEVYNYRELREELERDWRFRTAGDAEVVLAALATWGEAALLRLNGMFAFFLWDAVLERGLGARDRLGVKPFVHRAGKHGFEFASEAKALLAVDDERPRAHADSILEYLAAPALSGVAHSMFETIEHLGAGHLLRLDRAGLTVERWWDFALAPVDQPAEAQVALLRSRLPAAVALALRADVPVGVFLSGGFDSTVLAALATAQGKGAPPLSFTVEFEDQARYDYARSTIVVSDDTPFAALAAAELGLEHVRVPVARSGLLGDLAAISTLNEALPAWEQELAQHHLARAARRRRKAILVGDAADETHYGYHFLLDEEATRSPAGILRRFGCVPLRADRLHDPVAHFDARYRELAEAAGHRWEGAEARRLATTYLIVKRWLARLLHNGDIHTMAFSVEARVPFADVELLEAAARIPPSLGLRGGTEKWVLREAARGLLPESIRTRRKSALPKDQHTQALYQRAAGAALDESAGFLGEYVDLAGVRALCHPGRVLVEAERAALFRVIALAHWADHYRVTPT